MHTKNTRRIILVVLILVAILCLVNAVVMISLDDRTAHTAAADYSTSDNSTKAELSAYRKAYISGDNIGYTSNDATSLPFDPITSVYVKTTSGAMQQSTKDGNPALMLTDAQGVSVYMRVRDVVGGSDLGNGYKLGDDSWGATQTGNNKQEVHANGTSLTTGEIGSGVLLVQTSTDGKTWTQSTLSKFSNGYYTTDYLGNFHDKGEKEIYVPDGDAIKRGTWISVSFFYETKKYVKTEKYWTDAQIASFVVGGIWGIVEACRGPQGSRDIYEYHNIRETHTFFLVEDSVDVVTFNNMTTADKTEIIEVEKPSSEDEAEYKAQTEQYNNYLQAVVDQILPTMYDGSMSTTGIRINVTANPYLTVSAKRNGDPYTLPGLTTKNGQQYYELTESGRYDITISSYSKSKSMTLYVDAVSAEEAYRRYFGSPVEYNGQQYGDEFINYSPVSQTGNMRVFDANSSVPVFAGKLQLNLQHADGYTLPIHGVITNKSLGTTSRISEPTVTLTEFGEYEILFSTNANYLNAVIENKEEAEISGDVRVYRFNFKLIGKPTGSVVNRQLLSASSFGDLSLASPSDYAPRYWGVSRTTLNSGLITVAFADRESAIAYARDVIWGSMEAGEDALGKYWRLPDPDYPLHQKVISRSGWENATIVNTGAEKMVQECYFDLTDPYSHLTLTITEEELGADISTLNLSSLPLERSVVIWHSRAQRDAAIAHIKSMREGDEVIRYIGKQPYAVLHRDAEGRFVDVETGIRDYRFVRDALGIDSYTLVATDQEGHSVSLNYEQGIFEQFQANHLVPGRVKIEERTIYQTSTIYTVYYVTEQTATLTLDVDGSTCLAASDAVIECHEFSIKTVQGQIDPETYLRLEYVGNGESWTMYFATIDEIGERFAIVGEYHISLIDRFGNSRTFTIQLV